MSASGRNWGDAVVDNETLQFSVGSKPLFSVALPDVTQVSSQGLMPPKRDRGHSGTRRCRPWRGVGCIRHPAVPAGFISLAPRTYALAGAAGE